MDDKRDEKLVFKYIQRMEPNELKSHLENNRDKLDVTNIYDRSGYSPLHFAAYKNSDKLCEILCEYILTSHKIEEIENSEDEKMKRLSILKEWINKPSKGEEGFTALHFASFHGNMRLIKYLIKNGANVYAKNK
jgi:ankyrin repeat protein